MSDPEFWINELKLTAHPEGGYFAEVYRSAGLIKQKALPSRFNGDRNYATSIYFLLKGNQVSKFHRIASDEIWHFYQGSGLSIHVIHPDGFYEILKLGSKITEGESLQQVVQAGAWFGATVDDEKGFALVGCTVSPGFDFEDFEMADQKSLFNEFPNHKNIIEHLT